MNRAGQITRIDPAAGIPGGEIMIECTGLDPTEPSQCAVLIDGEVAPIVALSSKRVLAIVPELKKNRSSRSESQSGRTSQSGSTPQAGSTSQPGTSSRSGGSSQPEVTGSVEVTLESLGDRSEPASFLAGKRIAED